MQVRVKKAEMLLADDWPMVRPQKCMKPATLMMVAATQKKTIPAPATLNNGKKSKKHILSMVFLLKYNFCWTKRRHWDFLPRNSSGILAIREALPSLWFLNSRNEWFSIQPEWIGGVRNQLSAFSHRLYSKFWAKYIFQQAKLVLVLNTHGVLVECSVGYNPTHFIETYSHF